MINHSQVNYKKLEKLRVRGLDVPNNMWCPNDSRTNGSRLTPIFANIVNSEGEKE